MYYQSVDDHRRQNSRGQKLINLLYYKYKSIIETILLHPEISSPIAAILSGVDV